MTAKAPGYIIGFDFGLRHIGVAIGQGITASARGIATVSAREGKPDWRKIQSLVNDYKPGVAVIGLPLNMDNTDSPMAERARIFAKKLSQKCGITVELHDERLTTKDAKDAFVAAKSLGKASTEHELAACLILESWLSENA